MLRATPRLACRAARMRARLTDELQARQVRVDDGDGGRNVYVEVEAEAFRGLPLLKAHRLVTSTLRDDLASYHAVQIVTKVPDN